MPVLIFFGVYYLLGGVWTLLALTWVFWLGFQRAKQARWEAYIRNECTLYIEEVLGVRP